jgi:hypothetical protein
MNYIRLVFWLGFSFFLYVRLALTCIVRETKTLTETLF